MKLWKQIKAVFHPVLLFSWIFFLVLISTDIYSQSCVENGPVGTYPCPLNTVDFYQFDLSSSPDAIVSEEILGVHQTPCCGDELNENAGCSVIELLLHPQAVGIRIIISGANANSGDIKFTDDYFDVCSGIQYSMNDFIGSGGEICITGAGPFYIPVCKPGTNDYCVEIESIRAESFGDQITLLDDVVNCQYEVNVTATDSLANIQWVSIQGDIDLLECTSGSLDCLNPIFTPPGDLDSEEEYIYEVCGEFVDPQCGNTGIIVCDTVNIIVIPQLIVTLDDVTVCEGILPYEVNADVDPLEPSFKFYWYDDYDGPNGTGNLEEVTEDPYYDATSPGPHSVYVIDTIDAYDCIRSFIFNYDIVEEIEPEAIPEIINWDECNLTVTLSGSNSIDNYLGDNLLYEWDFGDGSSGFFENGSYTYSDCGSYTITLLVIDPDITGDCEYDEAEVVIEFDPDPPVLTCPSVVSGECQIDDVPIYQTWNEFINAPGADVVDNCMINPASFAFLGENNNSDPDGLPCPMVWTRTYYVEDMCGNSTTCEQTVEIWDLTPPVIDPEAQDYIFECVAIDIDFELQNWLDTHGGADATDNCTDQNDLVWTYQPANPQLSDECGATGEVEVTFYVTDECGNSSSTVATFTVVDTEPPVIDNCDISSLNETTECQGALLNEAFAIQWNNDNVNYLSSCVEESCSSVFIADDFAYTFQNTPCENTGDIVVTYYIYDDCGNAVVLNATLTFTDNTPPGIITPPQDLTIECDLSNQDALIQSWLASNGGAVMDEICNDIRWENDYSGLTISCGGAGSTNVTFSAIDSCGNSTDVSANIIVNDGTSPVVSCDPINEIVECDGTLINEAYADNWNAINISDLIACSFDPCGSFTVTSDYDFGNLVSSCGEGGTLTVNYFITDECGNVTPKTGILIIEDTSIPDVTCTPDSEIYECEGVLNESNADAWNIANIAKLENCSSDLCGNIYVTSNYNFANLVSSCGAGGNLDVIYTVTDDCGFLIQFSATLTIEDNIAPEISCPPDVILDCPAVIDPSNTGVATATDDCDGNPIISYDDNVIPGCGNIYTIERTWIATDDCGLSTSCLQIIAVQDITPPIIDITASDLTIECDLANQDDLIQAWLDSNGGGVASDVCNNLSWFNDYTPLAISCGGAGEREVVFIVIDDCGNISSTTATIYVVDGTSPIVSCDPINETVECDGTTNNEAYADNWNAINISDLIACSFDPCGSFTVTSDYDFGNLVSSCGEGGTLTANYFVTDECGNVTTKTGTLIIEDTSIPVVSCTPDSETLECEGILNESNADAWNAANITKLEGCSSDVCGNIYVTSNYDFANLVSSCGTGGTLDVIYTVTDDCGFLVQLTATFALEDNIAPEITCPPDVVLDCPADIDPSNTGVATAIDDCDGNPLISYDDNVIPGCGNTYTIERTWTATDDCGLTTTCLQIIAVQDITPPTIDVPASDLTIECDLSNQDALIQAWLDSNGGAIASDECNTISWSNDYTPLAVSCGGAGEREVIFTVTDVCGNSSTTIGTVYVVDGTSPIVNCDPVNETLECDGITNNEAYADGWNATNISNLIACSSDPCGSFTVTSDYNYGNLVSSCGEGGTLTVNYFVTDECGNVTPKVGTLIFEDTSIPVVSCTPDSETIECEGVFNESNADAWNAANITKLADCSSDICGNISVTSNYDFANLISSCGAGGTLDVVYSVTDDCGFLIQFTATFTIEDNIAPEITCPPDVVLDCPADIDPTNTGVATATDDCDGNPIINYDDNIIPGCGNTYTIERTWTVTDDCGLTTSCLQIIAVQDITPPTIDVAASDLTIECDLSNQDALIQAWLDSNGGAIASDACNTIGWANDYTPLAVSCGGAGEREVIFTVADACGNVSSTIATIYVIDGTSPIVNCDPVNETLECDGITNNEVFADAWNATNISNLVACSFDPCGSFIVTSDYNFANLVSSCGEGGTLIVNYFITDECGNVTLKIGTLIFEDTSIPLVSCTPDSEIVECEGVLNESNAEAWNAANISKLEDCSSDVCGEIFVTSNYDFANLVPSCGTGGVLEVIYTVTDGCGFLVESTATFTIVDNIAPEITCPPDVILECPADIDPSNTGIATAIDNCDGNPIISYNDNVIPGCGNTYTIERTWTATDDCGLITSCLQIIEVQDITPPSIVCPPDVTLFFDGTCGVVTTPTDLGTPEVLDFCDDNPIVSYTDNEDGLTECNGSGSIIRTWTAIDACGNEISCDQIITLIDNSNPIVNCPSDVSVYYDDVCDLNLDPGDLGIPTVTDNCDADPIISYADDNTGLIGCNNTGTILRTWTIEDACGNITECIQEIEVIDNIVPEIICPDITTVNYDVTCQLELSPQFREFPEVIDNCDSDPIIEFVDDESGLTGCNGTGTIIRTWTVTDACGNSATCLQTFIIVDDTAPEIICPPEVTIYYTLDCQLNEIPEFTGVPTINDNCDANPIITFVDDISDLTECNGTGTFTRTWTVEDVCGNVSECVQTIVVQDNTNPQVTCPSDVTLYYDENCEINTDPGVTGNPIVSDNCDEDPIIDFEDDDSGLNQCNNTGIIIRTWTIIDACDNETICTQIITIIDDSPPTIVCPEDITLDCPGDTDPSNTGSPETSDNCSVQSITYEDSIEEICPGNSEITRTWTVLDECGLSAECIQIISIIDETPPEIECPDDLILECDGMGNTVDIEQWLEDFSAIDNCSNVTLSNNFDEIIGECEGIGETIVTFTAVDECGNVSTCTASIVIEDNTPPVADDIIDLVLDNLADIPNIDIEIVIGEEDLCDPNPTVEFVNETDNGGTGCFGDPLIINRYYRVFDCSGNESEYDQEIFVETEELVVSATTQEILCTGESTGIIEVFVEGGTEPYTIDWDEDEYDGLYYLENLSSNIYEFTITDAIGCTIDYEVLLTETEDALQIELGSDLAICLGAEIEIEVDVYGGVGPYVFEWNLSDETTSYIQVSEENTYSVTVTDANGCFDIDEVFINVLNNPELDNPGNQESCDVFILPNISGTELSGNQAYFTGPNGSGTQYATGDLIDFSGTMYIFDETGTIPNCTTETSFNIIIIESPQPEAGPNIISCDVFILPEIEGTALSGAEAYYTESGGQGNKYSVGDTIGISTDLYLYDEIGDCNGEDFFTIDIIETPEIIAPDDITVCDGYTLPEIQGTGISSSAAYYSQSGAQGNSFNEGDNITTSMQLFVHTTAGSCFDEDTFNITVIPVPEINPFTLITTCDVFVLNNIEGNYLTDSIQYYTEPNGQGSVFNPGDTISTSIILYAYDEVLDCFDQEALTIEVVDTPEIDPVEDVTVCDVFVLQAITGIGIGNARYYTQQNGQGDELEEGDVITESTILYIYVSAGTCWDEENFNINIIDSPELNPISDIVSCVPVILPEISGIYLTGNEAYYSETGGNGDIFGPGDTIFTTQIIYVFDSNQDCSGEISFSIEILDSPDIDPIGNVSVCDFFILENISGSGVTNAAYYSETNGTGTKYYPGDIITSSTTLFAYVDAGDCFDEETFEIVITNSPEINDPEDLISCDDLVLPEITGDNLSGSQAYYSETGGNGIKYLPGDIIDFDTDIYAFDEINGCEDEVVINISIIETPVLDPIEDVTLCDSYELPEITGYNVSNANYFDGPNGSGTEYQEGDIIISSTTLYAFIIAGECQSEEIFDIHIIDSPMLDVIADQYVCDVYVLQDISGQYLTGDEAYFTGSGRTGNQLNPGDIVQPGNSIFVSSGVGQCQQEFSFEVILQEVPEGILTGGGELCVDNGGFIALKIELLNGNFWNFEVYKDGELYDQISTDVSPYSLEVNEGGIYTLGNVSNNGECSSQGQGSAEVIIFTSPEVQNFETSCSEFELGYTVSFEITGGDPFNYFINGEAINNPTGEDPYLFTIKMDEGVPYDFEVTDINGCIIIDIEGPDVDCGCITKVGDMSQELIEICGSSVIADGIYNAVNQFLDINDTLMFVLHQGNATEIINLIQVSHSPTFIFDETLMDYNTVYYISAVAGNAQSDGYVDLSDECTQVAIGQPVIFYELPTATINGDLESCEGEVVYVPIILTGNAPFIIELLINGQVESFEDIESDTFYYNYTSGIEGSVDLISITDAHCDGIVLGNANITFTEQITAEVRDYVEICNLDLKGSVIDFDTMVISGYPDGVWSLIGNSGIELIDNIVDFDGQSPGNYQFQYFVEQPGDACEDIIYVVDVNVLNCACPIIDIGPAGPFCNSELSFDLSSIENNSADGNWIIINVPNGSNPAYVSDKTLHIQDSDPGLYDLGFTLLNGDGDCPVDTLIQIQIEDQKNSGVPEPPRALCFGSDETIDLFELLTGADQGGEWSEITNSSGFDQNNATFSSLDQAIGQYQFKYEINSVSPCGPRETIVEITISDLPDAEAGPSFMLTCENQDGFLDGAGSSTGNFEYVWNSPEGNIVIGSSTLSPKVDQPGMYYLKVTDSQTNCSNIDSVEVFIDENFPNADAGPDLRLTCSQIEVQIDATNSSQGEYDYTWIGPDGFELFPDDPFIISTDIPGNYIFIIVDVENNCSNSDTVEVFGQIEYPIAEIDEPLALNCITTEIELDGSASTFNSHIIYNWNIENGSIINNINQNTLIVSNPGTYIISVLDTINNCISYDTVQVIQDIELPLAEAGKSLTLTCELTEINLIGEGSSEGSEFAYQWNTLEGNFVSGNNILNPIISDPGYYFLTVTNTDNGCESQDSVLVNEEIVPIEDFEVKTINPCFGQSEGIINVTSVVGNNGPYTYSLNNGLFQGLSSWENLVSGTYTVIVKNAFGCELEKEVTIYEGIDLEIDAGEDVEIELGDTTDLFANVNIVDSLISSVKWSPADYHISCIECLDPYVWPYENTTYTATLIDIYGCSVSDDVYVRVDIKSNVFAPNIFSPNGDGENDYFTLFTKENVDIVYELKIYSRWGELMYENFDFKPNIPELGWDGTFKESSVNPGVFVWFAKVRLINGEVKNLRGDVTLIK